jgi:hypothetical protein
MGTPRYNSRDGSPPLNRKVLVINNQPGPPMVGTLIRFDPITKANKLTPVVRDEATGEEFLTLGTVLPYSDRLVAMLQAVPEDGKTWEVFRDFRWFRMDLDSYCDHGEALLNEMTASLTSEPEPLKVPGLWERIRNLIK